MATTPETPQENPAAVPENKRAALAALSEKIAAQDSVSASKLNAVDKKTDVLTGLRELSTMIETGRVTGVTKAEVDAMHADIEGATLVSTRGVEDLAQSGLDAFNKLDPLTKQAAIGTAAVGGTILGLLGIRKLGRGVSKAIVTTWDKTLDVGEKVVKTTGGALKWLLKTVVYVGLGALATVGIQRAMAPGQAPAESTNQKA